MAFNHVHGNSAAIEVTRIRGFSAQLRDSISGQGSFGGASPDDSAMWIGNPAWGATNDSMPSPLARSDH